MLALASVLAAQEANRLRTWNDQSGNFEVRALFESSDGEQVTLIREDGHEIKVPLVKLSEKDRAFVDNQLNPPDPPPPGPTPAEVKVQPPAESPPTVLDDPDDPATSRELLMQDIKALQISAIVTILFLFGIGILLVAFIWWLVASFIESALLGMVSLSLPILTLVFVIMGTLALAQICMISVAVVAIFFLITRWHRAKIPFAIAVVGFACLAGIYFTIASQPHFQEILEKHNDRLEAERAQR